MSKVFLFKMPHVDVKRPTVDAPLTVQMHSTGEGFLISEKAGVKTVFRIKEDDLFNVAMILNASESVKNIAKHLMAYYAHDTETVTEFLSTTAEQLLDESMSGMHKKISNYNNKS